MATAESAVRDAFSGQLAAEPAERRELLALLAEILRAQGLDLDAARAADLRDEVVRLIRVISDPLRLPAAIATVAQLAERLEPAEAGELLARLAELVGQTTDPRVVQLLAAMAERLTEVAAATPHAVSLGQGLLATAVTDDRAAWFAALLESLLRKVPRDACARELVAILKYPTMGGATATDLVLDRLRDRLQPEVPGWPDGAMAGLQATLAAIRERFPEIDLGSPPVRPKRFVETLARLEGG